MDVLRVRRCLIEAGMPDEQADSFAEVFQQVSHEIRSAALTRDDLQFELALHEERLRTFLVRQLVFFGLVIIGVLGLVIAVAN